MTSVRWSHASPLPMSSFTGAENSWCLESERKTRIFHTYFYHVIYYIPIRAIRNVHILDWRFWLVLGPGFGNNCWWTPVSLTWCWQWRYSVFASLFDLRAAVPADEARLRGWFPWVSTGGNFDLWGEQASGSSWEIQVWWCCTRWRWTKASWFERKKGRKDNLEQIRTCSNLQPVQPFKDSALFTLLGTLLARSFRPCGN